MKDYQVKTIRALDRGLEVLEYLHKSRNASLHDLYLATGLPKATLTRVIATLERRGLIWQRVADGAFMASHTYQPRPPQVNDENYLVQVASPTLVQLCRKVDWPSILAVPRLDHMAVIETNSPRSYFSHIPLGPIGFRVNMLRSATGRAYLAFCSETERQSVLQRLAASNEPGNYLARRPEQIKQLLEETRQLGYGLRTPDFGGHYDKTRREFDDGRDSVAVPIWAGKEVVAIVNLTWIHKIAKKEDIIKKLLPELRQAAQTISWNLMSPLRESALNP
ncbi:helix-turn-helix domain-containing protein [Neopusillimonas maritima]|uniref:Transcriptional regulator n=1 Tax=Neopusillimonas maritima TaxID=2026239 RepID=A0A3A1YUQ6_9BURK|nr:helix-turn-helix domain-containing protein [Neopusillimonas maritima]RII83124.1 transcriptional regulator [Neopusillimonas maritima]RIY41251.1 transcriptional regulator [Neopusillimonas maritima]